MSREILFREAVIAFMSSGQIQPDMGFDVDKRPNKDRDIGGYCNGKDVAECKTLFKENLATVCATCPH